MADSAEQPKAVQQQDQEEKPRFVITLVEDKDGNRALVATGPDGEGMKLIDVRERLQWALNKLQDDFMVAYVAKHIDHMLEQKITPKGFRSGKILDFLKR
jgi:hypothetical protein